MRTKNTHTSVKAFLSSIVNVCLHLSSFYIIPEQKEKVSFLLVRTNPFAAISTPSVISLGASLQLPPSLLHLHSSFFSISL